jgi:hypothetical protein
MTDGPKTQFADLEEGKRMMDADRAGWRRWGPYLAERQWGTVREDYSADGEAWANFPHDHARSRAYRWGEDGIAGFCDDKQHWCLSLGLWNGRDPILKERMFGLTNPEGCHGEDVKELWWYLDGVPSHALMRMLYKYPQAAYPYDDLVAENGRRRGTEQPEYEIEDTGVFDDGRYFDVQVDYAKNAPDDILMRVTVSNRGPEPASLHVLPQLVARNDWSWGDGRPKPELTLAKDGSVEARRDGDPPRRFAALQAVRMLFCDNETNGARLWGLPPAGYPKDGVGRFVVEGDERGINPAATGTKCAAHARVEIEPGTSVTLRYRFGPAGGEPLDLPSFDAVFAARISETDRFYERLQQNLADPEARMIQRQALAGMLWSKQYYRFDVQRWLAGDPGQPAPPPRRERNRRWAFLDADDVISMPDSWEYPWFASWDLAFHCVTFALIDPDFAKRQLLLLLESSYLDSTGQIPAYEWAFGDANPPVQAWAALRIFELDRAACGRSDHAFIHAVFLKLCVNFTWWVNREDSAGRNLFQGGFLGLDNIGVFDRSKLLPSGGSLEQADGTAWMAVYALNMMRIALELSANDPIFQGMAIKFFDHFLFIARAMTDLDGAGGGGLWDEEDGFYYDVLATTDGRRTPLRVRSLVGLIPLCAVEVLRPELRDACPAFASHLDTVLQRRPELARLVSRWREPGETGGMLLSLLRRERMRRLLSRMFDPGEFLSPFGIRSLSKAHSDPYRIVIEGQEFTVDYEPGLSTTGMFGGNSNWRGPVWMPINVLLLEALYQFDAFYGSSADVEAPSGSGRRGGLAGAADHLAERLVALFRTGADGVRPATGAGLYRTDPHFAGLIPFNEYFHGETGRGLGASHQTGWTGLIALVLQPRSRRSGALTPITCAAADPDSEVHALSTAPGPHAAKPR